ncbi:MAG: DNA alkylation repair protein [Nitrospiraceae bacterium]|nr:MAG: DNA alkylation repair protein [Nitrospiraceae bacterium]
MRTDIVRDIKAALRKSGDKKIAEHSRRFFKTGKGEYAEGDKFLGIRVPVLRKLVRKYRGITIDEAMMLLISEFHEERLFSLLSLIELYKKSGDDAQGSIFKLYLSSTEYINNWDLIDLSAPHIVGVYLQRRNRAPLYTLAESESLWERRIAIMATFHFIRQNDFSDALEISRLFLKDREDLIHKATGWMLREVWKRDTESAEQFLSKRCRSMPRTTLRYAIEKLPEKKRIRYLKGEI